MFKLNAIVILILVLSATGAHGQSASNAGGKATGKITINDGKTNKTVELKHVYASRDADSPERGLRLTFTDKPLPADTVARWNYARVMAAEGKLHTLIIFLNPIQEIDYSALCLDTSGTAASDRECWMNFEGAGEASYDEPADEQVFEPKVYSEQAVSGVVRSSSLTAADYRNRNARFQYQVTFDAAIESDSSEVRNLSEASGPARAFLEFLKSLTSVEAAKGFLASERQKVFDGPEGQKRLARLKTLLQPVKSVSQPAYISADGKVALLAVSNEKPVNSVTPPPSPASDPDSGQDPPALPGGLWSEPLPSWPSRHPKYTVVSPVEPPPPPPPPPAAPPARRIAPPVEVTYMVASVRMILEGGRWKVDWLLFEQEGPNALLRLDTYKSFQERDKELTAQGLAEAKAEQERFKIVGGTRLVAGGGEAGKAYLDYVRAEKTADKDSYVKYLTGEQAEFFSQPDRKLGVGGYRWIENSSGDLTNIRVTGGLSQGNKTVLNVTGEQIYKTERYTLKSSGTGKVLMMMEGGQWKVLRQQWNMSRPAMTTTRR
jgi:hypothetical protein